MKNSSKCCQIKIKKISHLKNLNQDLEDKIRRYKIDEEKPCRSTNELEEIKNLNKIIMDKDNELTQGQRNIVSQELEICRHIKHMKEIKKNYDEKKKTHQLEIKKINDNLASNTEELFRLRIHNKTLLTKINKLKHS